VSDAGTFQSGPSISPEPAYLRRGLEREPTDDVFIQNLVNALQWGSFYALIALGYSMVYSILMLFNFATAIFSWSGPTSGSVWPPG
jgi:hypothetical protein